MARVDLRDAPRRRSTKAIWTAIALASIVALGVVPRWQQARFGLPYLHHWDEPFIANRAIRMVQTGDLNPHFFNYGSLLVYLDAAVDALHAAILTRRPDAGEPPLRSIQDVRYRGAVEDALTNAPERPSYFISHPSFYLWNRRLTIAFGLAAVLLAFATARRVAGPYGGTGAGLAAAFVLATNPLHIEQSGLVTTDVPATTLTLAAVWLAVRFVDTQAPANLCWAFVAAGLSISTKYNAAPVLLVLAAVVAAAARRSWRGYRRWLWAALVLLPVTAFLAATPYVLFDVQTFWRDTTRMVAGYVGSTAPQQVSPGPAHLALSLRFLGRFLGASTIVGALIGLAVTIRRPPAVVPFSLGLLVLLATSLTSVELHRNLILLYPIAAIAFGAGVAALLSGSRWRRARVAIVTVLLVTAAWEGARAMRTARRIGLAQDTRSQLVRRLREDGRWTRIGVARELRLHPLDLASMPPKTTVRSTARLLCAPNRGTEAVVLPAAVAAVLPDGQREAARLEGLRRLAGRELFAIAPKNVLWLDLGPPVSPGIVVVQPASPPAVLPAGCLGVAKPSPREWRRTGRAARPRRRGWRGRALRRRACPW